MLDFIDYIIRWIETKASILLFNIVVAISIISLTCFAVKKDVFITFSATKACLFSILMCCIWSGLFNTIALFNSEKEYLFDDLVKFLNVRTYIAANFFLQFCLCGVEAAMAAVIFTYFFDFDMSGIVMPYRNYDFVITFFLITMSCDMLGLLVGIFFKKITTIMTAIPVILIAQLLLSGCLFDLDGPLERVADFTTARWGFYALGAIADLNEMLPSGAELNIFRCESVYISYCWGLLILLTAICTFLSGIVLYFKVNYFKEYFNP